LCTFLRPEQVTQNILHPDFTYDDRNGWLTKIKFGTSPKDEAKEREQQDALNLLIEEQKIAAANVKAQELGLESANEAAEAALLLKELGIERIRSMVGRNKQTEQPNESVSNPERRRIKVLENSVDAPDKESIQRERTIQKNLSNIKAKAKAYLRPKYKNDNHKPYASVAAMKCHLC
jgi:hypothetical protein